MSKTHRAVLKILVECYEANIQHGTHHFGNSILWSDQSWKDEKEIWGEHELEPEGGFNRAGAVQD